MLPADAFPQLGEPRVPEVVPGEARKKLLMRDHSRPAASEAGNMTRRTSTGSATGSSGATSDAHAASGNAGDTLLVYALLPIGPFLHQVAMCQPCSRWHLH